MAEIVSSNNSRSGRVGKRSKKKSTRVDLTPMVDLGFLLITFFIFTTTLSTKKILDFNMPHDGDRMPVANSGALTILLGKNDNVFYYEGNLLPDASNFKASSFKNIREVLIAKKKSVAAKSMFVIIKPSDGSNYRNVVDILDEMDINVITHYALDNITNDENKLVEITENKAGLM